MTFKLVTDSNGNKILVEQPDGIEFALVSEPAPGRPGNPFHNPGTGQFTFAPPGVEIVTGSNILKQFTKAARDDLFRRAAQVNANQLAIRIIDGKVSIVLLREGRRLHSYSLGPESLEAQKGQQQPDLAKTGGPINLLEFIRRRDAVADAARQLEMTQIEIENFLRERAKRELSDIEVDQLVKEVRQAQLTDLTDYLHGLLNIRSKGSHENVRIAIGRGILRKSFANLTHDEARQVLNRLRDRGWSQEEIEDHIIGRFPKKLKDEIGATAKQQAEETN